MELKIFGKGFNFSQDGPGNRLVYHLKGCNMRCPWCSNPEGMRVNEGEFSTLSVEEVINEALISIPMFFENGGVTFTGGEATLQLEPLLLLVKELSKKGISVAIETNGTSPKLPELFPFLKHLIIDLKHPNSTTHKAVTGVANEVIKQNILSAAENGLDLLVRIPLINGFNASKDNLKEFVEFLKSVNRNNLKVEILKYHEYGKDKWQKCGLEYTMKDAFVTEQQRLDFETEIKNAGITVVRT
ncbi:MAG: radical SAM protein [Ruminococcaceae bacterium]|nr:radical SAM protein [Oscillospiraceae bacterium]